MGRISQTELQEDRPEATTLSRMKCVVLSGRGSATLGNELVH